MLWLITGAPADAQLACFGPLLRRGCSVWVWYSSACLVELQGGVWVLGLISGAPADAAGVRQGDELLAVGGVPTAQLSPFQAAGLLQGAGDDAPARSVALTVCHPPFCSG